MLKKDLVLKLIIALQIEQASSPFRQYITTDIKGKVTTEMRLNASCRTRCSQKNS